MGLAARLRAEIAAQGPLTVAQYMTRCLHDPQDGYYATRPALGEEGDFITAPLVSQMFGELIGLWAVETWRRLGAPHPFVLAEVGPGDGTLMADALRAARLDPAFIQAARLCLVETSAPLRAQQQQRLAAGPIEPRWLSSLDDLPADLPLILIANELLDCLPARQFIRTDKGWSERMVGLDPAGALAFGLAPSPAGDLLPPALPGAVLERSAAQEAFGAALGARIAASGGAALLIDYGRAEPGHGDTLQALWRHAKQSPLERPGEADLTVHADFPAVAAAAGAAGAQASPILTQGVFLGRLGIAHRAQALAKSRPDHAPILERQLDRLVGEDQMGRLFKVLALHAPSGLVLPGFEPEIGPA
jgi:NADH dehydrogenase [ubiquinone] 1 alpha subcomplex assembly factor 7